jgi:hypothetical protein
MVRKFRLIVLLAVSFYGFGSPAEAIACKTKSAAADYKCKITDSKKTIDIKYRYLKSKRRSVSADYLRDEQGPYARESFIVKIDPAKKKYDWQNCKVFGLLGKCVRKKIRICDSVLSAINSESYGLFNQYKYKRTLTLDLNKKSGSYRYFRKTPKASEEHRLDSFEVEFEDCKLIKEY